MKDETVVDDEEGGNCFFQILLSMIRNTVIPACGCIGYQIFGLHTMETQLLQTYFGMYDLTVSNSCLYTAHVGLATHIYNQPLLQQTSSWQRVLFTSFNTIMFNFGSILFWSVCKHLLPSSCATRMTFTLVTGSVLLGIGHLWVKYLNSLQVE